MKNLTKNFVIITIVVVIRLSLIGCNGSNSPKSLAKQTFVEFNNYAKAENMKTDTIMEISLALSTWSAMMQFMPTPSFKELNDKIEALSEADKITYQDELKKLLGIQ